MHAAEGFRDDVDRKLHVAAVLIFQQILNQTCKFGFQRFDAIGLCDQSRNVFALRYPNAGLGILDCADDNQAT
jgi:hypothetical protein